MKPNYGRIFGVLILLAAIGLGVGWKFFKNQLSSASVERAAGPPVTLSGKAGGEKAGFLEDAEVQKTLAASGLTLNVKKGGSVEMVREPVAGLSFLWPASQVNLESFRETGGTLVQAEEIFQSPLVSSRTANSQMTSFLPSSRSRP